MNSVYFLGCRKAVVVARYLLQRRQLRPKSGRPLLLAIANRDRLPCALYLSRHAVQIRPLNTFRSVPLFRWLTWFSGHETRQSASLSDRDRKEMSLNRQQRCFRMSPISVSDVFDVHFLYVLNIFLAIHYWIYGNFDYVMYSDKIKINEFRFQ